MKFDDIRNEFIQLYENSDFRNKFKEKGVECVIVMKVFEEIVKLNLIRDIKYQYSSEERNDQIFDFLINDKLIVEAKSPAININDCENQIISYLMENNNYNFGILTNGMSWNFYLRIENYVELNFDREIIMVASINISDEYFVDIIKNLKNIDDFYNSIVRYINKRSGQVRGRDPVIIRKREANDFFKNIINQTVNPPSGYYHCKEGYNTGDELHFKAEGVEIYLKIIDRGYVQITKVNIYDMELAIKEHKWRKILRISEDIINDKHKFKYKNPIDCIKHLKGTKRLRGKDNYMSKIKKLN